MPEAKILVLEREVFPRDHIGESQLPAITSVLMEMGAWSKVEEAGFPVKVGAMFRWGNSPDVWKLDFLVGEKYEDKPRPQPLQGQRLRTTFHVERAMYDQILLDHTAESGCEVRQGVRIASIKRDGDRVLGVCLEDGTEITSKYYVDATGHSGYLRRQMGVGIDEPTTLKNIAVWDYWDNPAWAKTVCKGGVRARLFSIGYGWIWFIPLSETKSSVGFVTHAEYFKASGMTPLDIYTKALRDEPFVSSILPGAVSLDKFSTTKDWSFSAQRTVGENWFLVGEAAGFADPVLSAGMSLAHVGARELAYILVALLRQEHDPEWLKSWYNELTLRRIRQHIRFADYWYRANGHWTELKAYTSEIAADAGLALDPEEAFRWLATGGFASDTIFAPAFAGYQLGSAKAVLQFLTGKPSQWALNRYNEFRLNMAGAHEVLVPMFDRGRINPIKCFQKGSRLLPVTGTYQVILAALNQSRDIMEIIQLLRQRFGSAPGTYHPAIADALDVLEAMVAEGWVTGKVNKNRRMFQIALAEESYIVTNENDTGLEVAET